MPIDLSNLSLEQKEAIRSALELNNVFTADDPATLTNKTLLNPVFSGTCSGQLNLASQVSEDDSSVLTRYTLRRELMMAESAIQRFNIQRTWNTRGGANADQIIGSGNASWLDTSNRAEFSTGTTSTGLDHTSWAVKTFGTPYISWASGSTMRWTDPFSFNFRINNAATAQKVEYWLGMCDSWMSGVPSARGVGIFLDNSGYRLWSHNGSTYAITATSGSSTLNYAGPTNAFPIDSKVRFTAMPANVGLTANTIYFVVANDGATLSVSSTLGGTAIAVTADITTGAQLMSLPTFSEILPGFPAPSNGFQTNQNILISSNGAGVASLYYSQGGNTNMSNTPVSSITIPTTSASGTVSPSIALTCTCKSLNTGPITNSHLAVVTASFAPFAV